MWDLVRGELIETLDLSREGDAASALAMNHDGRGFVVGTTRGRLLRFELDDAS